MQSKKRMSCLVPRVANRNRRGAECIGRGRRGEREGEREERWRRKTLTRKHEKKRKEVQQLKESVRRRSKGGKKGSRGLRL